MVLAITAAGQEPEGWPSEARPGTKPAARPCSGRAGAPAVAALRMEPVTLWVIGRVEQFPRKHRFTVANRRY